MKILLTGAAGFIGKAVMKEAWSRGHAVIPLIGRIEDWSGADKADCLIHLAWPSNIAPDNPQQLETIVTHFSFLKQAAATGIKNMTIAGTCLEPYDSCYYVAAKKALFGALRLLSDVRLKWLRYHYVYGEGQREEALYTRLVRAIENKDKIFRMSHGQQERDFISVKDAAIATIRAAEGDVTGIFAVGSGKPQKVINFVSQIMRDKNHDMQLDTTAYHVPPWEPFSFHVEGM